MDKSLIKEICDYWYTHNNLNNEKLRVKDVAQIFKKDRHTISCYLKMGTKLNWCVYKAKGA